MPYLKKMRITFASILTVLTIILAADAKGADSTETKYLVFQVWPAQPGYPGIPPEPRRLSLTQSQMDGFAEDLVKAIGRTGDAKHKLGFAVGPFSFDVPDDETRQWIRDAFAAAKANDVAVAIHIDDSMSWGRRTDLTSNPDNIECADWSLQPSTSRRLDWGPTPTKFPPQMCYNARAIVGAAKARAELIGHEIKQQLAELKVAKKEHLFAGVIAGSETMIGEDFATNRPLGFRALSHRGFSEQKPPQDADAERVSIVKEWMELWANSLHAGGVPGEKIYCHIAFTDQGLRKADAKESYIQKVHFATPEVAFSPAYRPGFSTYPEGGTFKEVHAELAKHGSPVWISAEGTNVSPTSMPGEATMETYLARMFNHGAVMTNIFSWGIGGEKMRDNFFRKATENPEALAAYAKFLRGESLIESATSGFSGESFQAKMRKIQEMVPSWVQKSGQQSQMMPLMQKLQGFVKDKKWQEANSAADDVLALMNGASPQNAEVQQQTPNDAKTVQEQLPAKVQRIQKGLPAWVKGNPDRQKKATGLMKSLDQQMKSRDFEQADKTADSLLALIGDTAAESNKQSSVDDETRKHILHDLGSAFIISRKPVREELQLSDEQKQQLDTTLTKIVVDIQEAYTKFNHKPVAENEKLKRDYREQARTKFLPVVKRTLNTDQFSRYEQLMLQHEGPGGFGRSDIQAALMFTQDQRKKLITAVQEMQAKVEPLMREAKSKASADEIRPKVLQLRHDCESQIVSFLTESQKKKWSELRGEPFNTIEE